MQHTRSNLLPGCLGIDVLARLNELFPKADNTLTSQLVAVMLAAGACPVDAEDAAEEVSRGHKDWSTICSCPEEPAPSIPSPGIPLIRSWEDYHGLLAHLRDAVRAGFSNTSLQEKAWEFQEQMGTTASKGQTDASSPSAIPLELGLEVRALQEAEQERYRQLMYVGGCESECPQISRSTLSFPRTMVLELEWKSSHSQNKDSERCGEIRTATEKEASTPAMPQSVPDEGLVPEQMKDTTPPQPHADISMTADPTSEGPNQAIIEAETETESQLVGTESGPEHPSSNDMAPNLHQASEGRQQDPAEHDLLKLQEILMSDAVDESMGFTPGLLSPNTVASMFEASLGK